MPLGQFFKVNTGKQTLILYHLGKLCPKRSTHRSELQRNKCTQTFY